ncbi:RTA1 like protein-domain-containing protein [Dactylonectria estremocensis]|uniref:RTA1 like protein-domain-containing protein n=1 Tax=Dactylonectria estremocensis TaxID=1079267 RepID=A0A9P9ELZ3_9HYPO|nr:RTA1 like protein-domain-containing protein [Dactylonectria estremocensis]
MTSRNLTRDDAFGPENYCNLDLCPLEWSMYTYIPSLSANVVLLVLFALIGIVHGYLGFRWKSWGFMAGMLAGCAAELVGYAGRIMLHDNPFQYQGFMIQIVCLTFAPVFYTASIYITLSKTIEFLDASISRVKPKFFYWFFIPFDLLCLVLQALGGGMSAGSDGSSTGVDISMAGLVLQVIILVLFIIVFADYMWRYWQTGQQVSFTWRTKTFFAGLCSAIVFILTRCAYRVAELRDGYDGELFKDETTFIILEGVMIVLVAGALCFGHPGLLIRPAAIEGRTSSSSRREKGLYSSGRSSN